MATKDPQKSDCRRFHLYEAYVKAFGINRADPSADPYLGESERPWWPMRYFIDDWILCVWVYRIRNRSRCEVGLFLAEDHTKYVKDSGIKGGLIFLLTQTYHLLGRMEVHFVGPKPGQDPTLDTGFEPVIPESIRRFAGTLGVTFRNPHLISDAEGRKLYARLTGFPDETITELEKREIDITRACYVIQRDFWSFEHVEYFLKHAHRPERLFSGGASPLDRLEHQRDLVLLRTAILDERFQILLAQFSEATLPVQIHREWVSANRATYVADRDLRVPTLGTKRLVIRRGEPLTASLLPRSATGYSTFCDWRSFGQSESSRPNVLVVARDIEWCCERRDDAVPEAIVPVYDTLAELDAEIELRLRQSTGRTLDLSERHG